MNARETRFCQEYAKGETATNAAINAGYSPKTAYSQGSRLLKKAEVQKYIQQLQAKADDEAIAKTTEVKKVFTEFLRGRYPSTTKIRAGIELVKMDTGTDPAGDVATDPAGDPEQDETEQGTKIYLPYSPLQPVEDINAVMMPDGAVIPLSGHEKDDVFIYSGIEPAKIEDFEVSDNGT